nr:hypothetical protein [Sodalis-like endosymbiont of Proechinophthirus fluctus]
MVQRPIRAFCISPAIPTLCAVTSLRLRPTLAANHRIERRALFDQFPYTHHMECGVLLVRKATAG